MIDLAKVVSGAQQTSPAAPVSSAVALRVEQQANELSVQSVMGGENSTFENIRQQLRLYLADRDYFFGMRLNTDSGELLAAGRALRRGETYHLQVSAGLYRYQPLSVSELVLPLTQYPVKVTKEIGLRLFIGTAPAPLVETAGAGNKLEDWSASAEIQIPADFSGSEIDIELASERLGSLVAALKYPVETPKPTGKAPVTATYLPAEPPRNTALLHVDADGEDLIRFTVFLRERVNRPEMLGPVARPSVAPGDYADETEYLQALREKVHELATVDAATLTQWMEQAVAQYGDECSMVVIDKADSQIPWEMFKLRDNRFLGAVATVVRWTEAQYRSQPVALQTADASLRGRLEAYVHQQDWNDAPAYLRALHPPPAQDPDDLETALLPNAAAAPVALVYLNYGGLLQTTGDSAPAGATRGIAKRYEKPVRFSYADLELDPRPLFFVDAAYSGRIVRSAGKFCGFAQTTLTQVAGAYIGTLGPVPRAIAADVAQRFFLEAAAGVRPAQLLRKLRADAAAAMRNPAVLAAERRKLAYAFLYVYYGNPLLQVTI